MQPKPLISTADKILPYLKRIDESRHYTNFGALNAEYQKRVGEMFDCPCITGSSATSLITASLMALDLPKGSLVAMPSWTFPATAAAVVSAGLRPYFHDVTQDGVLFIDTLAPAFAAVVMVAPFGEPIHWNNDFHVPIIIDAAAGFDAFSTICLPSKVPVVISTHATKSFATGEGGLLFSEDTEYLEKVRRITNFGLSPDRRIEYTGLNAKFSEYHAAVGLAELDEWPEKRKLLLAKTQEYGLDYAVTQIPVRGEGKKGIYGCHVHKAYEDYPRGDLPVTNDLIENIGCITVGIE